MRGRADQIRDEHVGSLFPRQPVVLRFAKRAEFANLPQRDGVILNGLVWNAGAPKQHAATAAPSVGPPCFGRVGPVE